MTEKVDIVERLRNPAMISEVVFSKSGDTSSAGIALLHDEIVRADMREAAEEIKMLRAAIKSASTTIANLQQIAGNTSIERPFSEIQKEIRASFSENDKEMRSAAGLDNG